MTELLDMRPSPSYCSAAPGPLARFCVHDATAAAAWGLLRNALQEFPALAWAGSDTGRASAPGVAWDPPAGSGPPDAFGAAASAGVWAMPRMLPSQAVDPDVSPRLTFTTSPVAGTRALWSGVGLPAGAWLITGGMGGLGQLSAQWAALCGATQLLLVDGRAGVAGAAAALALLASRGCAVTVARGDVATAECARAAGTGWLACAGGALLQGALHAAGVLQACDSEVKEYGTSV